MKEVFIMTPEHERYVWLRDGKSRRGGYCGSAPYVISPTKSRLYAIASLRAAQLDAEVDYDILENKASELDLHNAVVERELMYRPDKFSDEYANCLYVLAGIELGWDASRFERAMKFTE